MYGTGVRVFGLEEEGGKTSAAAAESQQKRCCQHMWRAGMGHQPARHAEPSHVTVFTVGEVALADVPCFFLEMPRALHSVRAMCCVNLRPCQWTCSPR